MNQECTAELLNLVASQQPRTCLVLSDTTLELLTEVGAQCELMTLAKSLLDPQQYKSDQLSDALAPLDPDLVIVGEMLAPLAKTAATEVVAMLRNQLNAKIILLQNPSFPLLFQDLLGLGFKRECKSSEQNELIDIYSYDIGNYNKKRDWNNSRFWANPQNFEKYRW